MAALRLALRPMLPLALTRPFAAAAAAAATRPLATPAPSSSSSSSPGTSSLFLSLSLSLSLFVESAVLRAPFQAQSCAGSGSGTRAAAGTSAPPVTLEALGPTTTLVRSAHGFEPAPLPAAQPLAPVQRAFAVVEVASKQFKVAADDVIIVNKLKVRQRARANEG